MRFHSFPFTTFYLAYNNLTQADQEKLWTAFRKQNFRDFWEVNNKLNDRPLENAPVRFCLRRNPTTLRSLSLTPKEGGEITLLSCLQEVFPSKFGASEHSLSLSPRVLVQGVYVPLDTPLSWLCLHCCHPDSFVYVSIIEE